jgi:hypothetical protein
MSRLGMARVRGLRGLCNVLASMRAHSIEVFEWDRADVMLPRLPRDPIWSTYATSANALPVTGMRLAHSVVKADYLIARNYALPSLGFLLQMDEIMDFRTSGNLRLLPGASSILNDVSQTGLAARVRQGLSLLFAEQQGYAFVGHLASDPWVLSYVSTFGRQRVADFLFEDSAGDRMLLESKATFSLQNNECSRVKSVLKQALREQVDPWMGRIAPTPAKGFAIYSCLREAGNPTPSSITFVDPPPGKDDSPIELPSDWAKRHNYGGWLRAMGLRRAASRLRGDEENAGEPENIRFRLAHIGARQFAVLPPWLGRREYAGQIAIGIDVAALRAISAAIQGAPDALLEYRPAALPETSVNAQSILNDGTIFGLIDASSFDGVENFRL